MDIVIWPDDRLTKKCAPVLFFAKLARTEIDLKVAQMIEIMVKSKGCGLAAPQVGWNRRIFIVSPSGRAVDARVFINPKLTIPDGKEMAFEAEGCLSLPGREFRVPRYASIRIQAIGLNGLPIDETMTGRLARIAQHEFDHIEGLLVNRFEEIVR